MKISVIVPVYNAEKYLEACLDSLLQQTYKNLEIIVINDGSSDHSLEIARKYEKNHNCIRVYDQVNKGVSSARNNGIAYVTGDWISFIDADDTLDSDMYECLIRTQKEYSADIVHCGYKHVVGEEIRLIHDTGMVLEQTSEEALNCLIARKYFVGSLWNKLFSVKIIQGLSFREDLKINEDILFVFQAFSKCKKAVFIDLAKYNYIAHRDSSACFVTKTLKKTLDSTIVNKIIYETSKGTVNENIAAKRYMASLNVLYRCESKSDRKRTAFLLWELSKKYRSVGFKIKLAAFMSRFCPPGYAFVFGVYDKIRKPNWEV